jgi:NADH:ubiquinone oxidoreductase subunit 6 (subunit J)
MNPDLSTLPVGVLVAVGALAVVQLTLDVVALVDLYRRPAAQVVSGNKWVWVAVVLLVSLLGAILYLVVGRTKAVAVPVPPASRPVATEGIADALYGPRDDTDLR